MNFFATFIFGRRTRDCRFWRQDKKIFFRLANLVDQIFEEKKSLKNFELFRKNLTKKLSFFRRASPSNLVILAPKAPSEKF